MEADGAAWPNRGETLFLHASTPGGASGMQPPPPRGARSAAAMNDDPRRPAYLGGLFADAQPLSPTDLLQPPQKRARSGGPQQPPQQAASPNPHAPPALFVSEPSSGFSPRGPLSPLDGRLRRSSVMSSSTVAPYLPPISPLNLGGFDLAAAPQQQPRQQQHQHQHQQSRGKQASLRLAPLDVEAAAAGLASTMGPGGLTPHLGEAITPGRLLLGSPVDLGDSLERAVDVAAELGLLSNGSDMCGLLASPEAVGLTSPRGMMLASLRDIVLASPLGIGFLGGTGGAAGTAGAAVGGGAGITGASLARTLAGELSPLATPLFATNAPRLSWAAARRDSNARTSLLSAATPAPELAAWVPCSAVSTGGSGGSGDAQPPWLAAAGQQQQQQQQQQFAGSGGPGGVLLLDAQRGTSKGPSRRPQLAGIRNLKARQRSGELPPLQHQHQQAQQQQAQQQQDDTSNWQQHDQQLRSAAVPERKPWHGRSGVPAELLRELAAVRKPAPPAMLDTIERVWECAGRLR
ncbi:hypothetical protein Rsub_10826 [Raphidocelis subcapitata]|uniref:Uncharacterized protein n=1 Tax=Raphidocelis subcapitata TaxID=307507 RepID=A0A2V0PMN5_9CHLO|nr:hypothetical protein Rsub_10826 [Raphidocelis subcapitata]|eukprot:GBF98637.1 hypothetical protein Rsub_10826 [Raphidocelis subcapitata]